MSYDPQQSSIKQLCKEYAEGTKRVVFFVGAGCSAEVGMPTWGQLRDGMQERISAEVDTTSAADETLENYRELEELAYDNEKLWDFFSHASTYWPTTYIDYLISNFDDKIPNVPTPSIYKRIWSMSKPRQIFSLNVDGLVSRAFREVWPDPKKYQLLEYDGFNVVDSLSFLARDNFCLIQLHGAYHQKSRWIMNADQRTKLLSGYQGRQYAAYVQRLFSEYNVIFIGVNPTDIAISPFLSQAAELSLIGKHFWICPDPSPETEQWAQKSGIRLIRYSPEKNEDGAEVHGQEICNILDQVERFVSKETPISLPQTNELVPEESIGEPLDLVKELNNDRVGGCSKLAGAVLSIISKHDFDSKEMKDFLKKFSVPIQMASTIDDKTKGFDQVGDYNLVNNIQSRGVSSVWTVTNNNADDTNYYALKLLTNSGLHDPIERQSFRRGVESLYLLTQYGENVAPKYVNHYEVPLCVVMENIPGATVREFRSSFESPFGEDLMKLFKRICETVLKCHRSEGQILHRDIKPGNILLEHWHLGYEIDDAIRAHIRLINFDLSWHRFTSGNTKAISAEDIGYYAPEQRYIVNSLPPRSASTDVYMLGMVLFFLITGENPPDGGARLKDWRQTVDKKIRSKVEDTLVGNRISRLVYTMTESNSENRLDLSSAIAELDTLIAWYQKNTEAIDDDLLVEHLAVSTGREYKWERSAFLASVGPRESVQFELKYQHAGHKATFSFYRLKSDADNRAKFGGRMNQRIQSCIQLLELDGWDASARGNKGIEATIRVSDLRKLPNYGSSKWENIYTQLLTNFD